MDREDLLEQAIVYSSSPDYSNTNKASIDVSDEVDNREPENDNHVNDEPENDDTKNNVTDEEKKMIEFTKIIGDFLNDIRTTYPELSNKLKLLEEDKADLFNYCKVVYPERFFDILYQNEDIFKEDSKTNTYFLPTIDFRYLWNVEEVSDKTKNIIWKYLQLILFNVVGSLEDKEMFGEAANIFETINKSEFKDKLEETIGQMGEMFKDIKNEDNNIDEDSLPDTEKIHDHISGIMDGKLGKLAHEIAEETAKELNLEEDDNPEELFNNLIKDPTKLMGLVKNVGSKLDNKMKSGNLSESELLSEATDIMKKMNDMPGMKNMQELFKNLNIPGNKKGKMNMSAVNNHMRRNNARSNLKKKLNSKKKDNIELSTVELEEATKRSDKMMNELLEDLMKEEEKVKSKKK